MLRTIEAPGVEIREVDKSVYSRSLTGSNVLVTGFADKGKDFEPTIMTSKNAWINFYGKPSNEAERYFYRASMEVINQGGRLYASKLPYDNEAADVYVAKKYSLETCLSSTSNGFLTALLSADKSIKNVLNIDTSNPVGLLTAKKLDEYSTGEESPDPNTFFIVDSLKTRYDNSTLKNDDGSTKECLGLMPIIITPANALYYQSILSFANDNDSLEYQAIKSIGSMISTFFGSDRSASKSIKNTDNLVFDKLDLELDDNIIDLLDSRAMPIANHSAEITIDDETESEYPFRAHSKFKETLSNKAARMFPPIQYVSADKLDRDNFKNIGIVLFKAYVNRGTGKIDYDYLESFIGSLDRNAKDPITGASIFLDDIVNLQSKYIEFYSNCEFDSIINSADMFFVKDQHVGSLGFYNDMMSKEISFSKSISEGLDHVFEKTADINERDIDIVVDGGISNIAQYVSTIDEENKKCEYDPESKPAAKFNKLTNDNTTAWRAIILDKYDNFCKNIRKDCMFIADGLRSFCLQGSKKIIRSSKPSNTIDANIIPNLKFISGINTSYGAGYCDWFQVMDEFSGKVFWCPPSIQACGVYINTDLNANYWDAPAGLNRGLVTALDVAFTPTIRQAGEIYLKNWNYAIDYPQEGITLEGQKTFQAKPSAFDRVNVRRLFLRLERYVYKIARYYVYEGNTEYTRQRFVDAIKPYFEEVKFGGGMYDYKIICDETINTPEVIDNNELRIKIGIKPVKTAEFILLQFIALRTGGSFDEM